MRLYAILATALLAAQCSFALDAANQAKVDQYTKKLVELAANPAIVKAVKDANAKGAGDMNNAKWDALDEKDPIVQETINNDAAKLFKQYESDKNINKLYLRDKSGAVVAGTGKTTLFNAGKRKHIATAILDGKPSFIDEVKPDPSTGIKSVQLAVPVMDGGSAIGVLHTAINAQ